MMPVEEAIFEMAKFMMIHSNIRVREISIGSGPFLALIRGDHIGKRALSVFEDHVILQLPEGPLTVRP